MPKLHHATSVPITLRIGRVAHALAADAAEIDGRSLNNELLHLIELGLGVRAKQEIVRKAMTRDPSRRRSGCASTRTTRTRRSRGCRG